MEENDRPLGVLRGRDAKMSPPTFDGFRNLAPLPSPLCRQLSFGHVTAVLGGKWMWPRPALDGRAKLSAAGPPRAGAFEGLLPAEIRPPVGGEHPRTSGDRALVWDCRLRVALFLGSSWWTAGT